MEGQYGQTMIHPVALAITIAMSLAIFVVRRGSAAVPLLIVACFVTHAQRIVIAGLDFSMLRIVVLCGLVRVFARGEASSYRVHKLDYAVIAWLVLGTVVFSFGPRGSMDAFINRLGLAVDAAGVYFLFRILLREVRDVYRTIATFSWIAVIILGPMVLENLTGRNLFSALGGVPELTNIRDGRMRCQASFSHPIMAGTFGASTAALLGALWLAFPRNRVRYTIALVASVGVVVLSASSGPLIAIVTGMIGWALWFARAHMRLFRWTVVAMMVVLHFVREKPIWHLIGRISSVTGGTGYHRYKLIDEFIIRFDEWWLFGSTSAHWRFRGSSDVTNQYILEGLRGGLATLIAFITMLTIAFRTVGRTVDLALAQRRRQTALLAWGLGVCLASHSMAFVGVSYFGQLQSIFYLHLAMIPSLAQIVARRRRAIGRPRAASDNGVLRSARAA